MKSAAAQLLDITAKDDDKAVAGIIASALLESDRQPYGFSINHDTRPPKCLACPFDYDWARKGRVGIETPSRAYAYSWIVSAVLAGYEVTREGREPVLTYSLTRVRSRAERHQTPRSDTDDDIPF